MRRPLLRLAGSLPAGAVEARRRVRGSRCGAARGAAVGPGCDHREGWGAGASRRIEQRRLARWRRRRSRPNTCAPTGWPANATDSIGRSSRASAGSECDHGRDPDPSCTHESAVNSAGAGGPMQFLASTWASYGVDGDGDGRIDRWDAADAIYGAANYLRASGAPGDYRRAIYAYNHAGWYVAEVEHWAALYRGSPSAARTRGGRGHGNEQPDLGAVRHPENGRSCRLRTGTSRWCPPRRPPSCRRWWWRATSCRNSPTGQRAILTRGERRARTARARSTTSSTARGSPDRRNPPEEPAGAGLRRLGCVRAGAVGEHLRDHRAHRPRLHRDRRIAAGYKSQRHRRGPQPRSGWSALAHPRPHPHLGALVRAPSTWAIEWP